MKLKALAVGGLLGVLSFNSIAETTTYTPAPENIEARKRYSHDRFGIFIHWGIYSMFGQGEWYLNNGPKAVEYAKAARGFYPADAIDRLNGIGEWLNKYGETIYGTTEGDFPAQSWGTSTRNGDKLYVHIMTPESTDITLPMSAKVKKAVTFDGGKPVKFTQNRKENTVILHLEEIPQNIDYIIQLETK